MKQLFIFTFACLAIFSSKTSNAQVQIQQQQQAKSFAEAKTVANMIDQDLELYSNNNIIISDIQKSRISILLEGINQKLLYVQMDLTLDAKQKEATISQLENAKYNNMMGVLQTIEHQKAFEAVLIKNKLNYK